MKLEGYGIHYVCSRFGGTPRVRGFDKGRGRSSPGIWQGGKGSGALLHLGHISAWSFDNNDFRQAFLRELAAEAGLEMEWMKYDLYKEMDRLAAIFGRTMDMEGIYEMLDIK